MERCTFSLSGVYRFHGQDPEPRQGLSSGHIPHSISLPFSNLLSAKSTTTPAYQTLLAPAALEQKLIEALGEERWNQVKSGEKRVATTCGSGMTAAVLWLALSRLGVKSKPGLYDEVSPVLWWGVWWRESGRCSRLRAHI